MKKFINFIIALSIFFAFTGCTTKNDISTSTSSSYEDTAKSTELEESSLEHADTFIPDAKEYDVIDVEVTGQKLLEVFGNVRKEEIPESNTEQ